MAESTTTTTTTTKAEDEKTTTTTTTQAVQADAAPKGDNASVNHPGGDASPAAERQGEVAIDKGAKTDVVGGFGKAPNREADAEVQAQNIENAKQDALRNDAREQQAQPKETGQQ